MNICLYYCIFGLSSVNVDNQHALMVNVVNLSIYRNDQTNYMESFDIRFLENLIEDLRKHFFRNNLSILKLKAY